MSGKSTSKERFDLKYLFLYDTQACVKEEDDPRDAIIYFYPASEPEEKQITLCGQLMGVFQFCSSIFSSPTSLALTEDQFAFKVFGRFILALGSGRKVITVILDQYLEFLFENLTFLFGDLECFLVSFKNRSTEEYLSSVKRHLDNFIISIESLHFLSKAFLTHSSIHVPRSGKQIQLLSRQILCGFQNHAGVLGCSIFYKQHLFSSQFNQELNRNLLLLNSSQSKIPGRMIDVNFELHPSTKLLSVFISKEVVNVLERKKNKYVKTKGTKANHQDKTFFRPSNSEAKSENSKLSHPLPNQLDYYHGRKLKKTKSFDFIPNFSYNKPSNWHSISLDSVYVDVEAVHAYKSPDDSYNVSLGMNEEGLHSLKDHLSILLDSPLGNKNYLCQTESKYTCNFTSLQREMDLGLERGCHYTCPEYYENVCLYVQTVGNVTIFTLVRIDCLCPGLIQLLFNIGNEASKLEKMLCYMNEQMFVEYSEGQLIYFNDSDTLFDHGRDRQIDIDTILKMRESFGKSGVVEEIVR